MMASQTAKSAMISSTAADEHKKIENESKVAVVCKENEQSEKDAVIDYVHSLQELFSKFGLYTDRGKDFEDLVKQLENPATVKVFVEEQLALIRKHVLTPDCVKKKDIPVGQKTFPNFLSEGSSDGRKRTFSPVPKEPSGDFVGDSHEIFPGPENAEDGKALDQSLNPSANAYNDDQLQLLPSREEVENMNWRISALEQNDKKRRAEYLELKSKFDEFVNSVWEKAKQGDEIPQLKQDLLALRDKLEKVEGVEYLQLKAVLDKMVICLKRCVNILLEKAKQCDEIPQIKRDLLAVQDRLEKVEASVETKKTAQDDGHGHSAGPMFD